MKKISLLMDYESVMINRKTTKNYHVIRRDDEEEEAPQNAAFLLKYVFETLLGWTPFMVRDYLNKDIISWLKLENAIKKIPFPPELNRDNDFFYIASYLYPQTIPYKKEKYVLAIFEREYRKEKPKYPKNFFKGAEGKENFEICFRYALSEVLFSSSNEDIYKYCSNRNTYKNFLSKYKLANPLNNYYSVPLDAIHSVLPEADKSELLYNFYFLESELRMFKWKGKVYDDKN